VGRLEQYRQFYEHEKWANAKMLAMVESVPEGSRARPEFQRAVNLVAHLAACRENWLDRMVNDGTRQRPWFEEAVDPASLRARIEVVENEWTTYLGTLTEEGLDVDFEFDARDGRRYRWNVEGQIAQLVGHAFYHRGQIALLVDQLGGETDDTDYLYWAYERNPRWGLVRKSSPEGT
jgi:uncharacterized damage-inducible protein DinB